MTPVTSSRKGRDVPVLGTAEADLYDLSGDQDDGEEEALVDAARTRYQKVAADLRQKIISGDPAPGANLDGQAKIAKDADTDPAVVNRALAVLSAEGLVRVEHGKKTVVLERSRWIVEFELRLPPGREAHRRAAGEVGDRLRQAVAAQPAVTAMEPQPSAYGRLVTLAVESADLAGATTVALGVCRHVAGPLPVAAMTAREA